MGPEKCKETKPKMKRGTAKGNGTKYFELAGSMKEKKPSHFF